MQLPQATSTETPPGNISGILRRLGPGLIIAGSIVGSGELIATTKTGAQAGFWLLWLIIIGCVIKVFAQVEFGRHAISSGQATMTALDEVPGPRLRVNWVLWYWVAMFLVTLGQLGGIVGGVGSALAMSLPIDGSFNRVLEDPVANACFWSDDVTWAAIVTGVTIVLLVVGRYGLIQHFSTAMVAAFTAVTIFNLFALQTYPAWRVHASDVAQGMSFRLPPIVEGLTQTPLVTALATFGIIGVGANELIAYPYWCLEKGYARFAGPRDDTPEWAQRARGWMRVMRWDAGISMLVYTFATVAFYLLGAAVLHREGLDPQGNQMIRVLGEMYVPVFGLWAKWLFLFGAIAVLYSTFFVATAGHTRVAADALCVFGLAERTERDRLRWIRAFCVIFPLFAFVTYVVHRHPVALILASGVMQAIMLPILGGATLYFRYCRCDRRIAPGRLWDVLLWVSVFGLLLAGGWIALSKLGTIVDTLLALVTSA